MKYLFLTTAVLWSGFASAQSGSRSEYPFEDLLMQTITEYYLTNRGIQIGPALDSVEADLIRLGLLSDTSGES